MIRTRLSAAALLSLLALAGCLELKPTRPLSGGGRDAAVNTLASAPCVPVTALESICTKFNEVRCRFEMCPGDSTQLWVDFDISTSLVNLKGAELLDMRSKCFTELVPSSPGVPFWEYMRGRWRSKENRRRVTTLPMSGAQAVPDAAFISIAYEKDQSDKSLIREVVVPLPDGMPFDGGLSFTVESNDSTNRALIVDVRNGDGSSPVLAIDLMAVVWEAGGTFVTQPVKDIPGLAAKVECMRYEANVTRGLNKAFTRNCSTTSGTIIPPTPPAVALLQDGAPRDPVPESAPSADGIATFSAAGQAMAASPSSLGAQPPAKAVAAGKVSDGTLSGLSAAQERLVEGTAFDPNNCTLPAGKPPDIKATYQDAVAPSKLHMATLRFDTAKSVTGSGITTPPAPFWEYIRGRWRGHSRGRTKTLPMSGMTTDLVILTFTQQLSSTSDAQWVVLLADGIDSTREEIVSVTVTGSAGPPTVIELKAKGGTLDKDLEVVETLDAGKPPQRKKVHEVKGLDRIIIEARELAGNKKFDTAFARSCPDQPAPARPSDQ